MSKINKNNSINKVKELEAEIEHGSEQAETIKKTSKGIGSFQKMGLSSGVYNGVMKMGYKLPTPIQRAIIPLALTGKDIVAMARTGSGKTAAFVIPVLEKLGTHQTTSSARCIILSPTRELAFQTFSVCKKLGRYTDIRSEVLVGGDNMDKDFEALARYPDILVATPGRLMHLLMEVPDFNLKGVEYIVYDEADQLFEMGFAPQLNEICRQLPVHRQSFLISATLPGKLMEFSRAGLNDAEIVRLDVESKLSPTLSNTFLIVRQEEKTAALLYLLRDLLAGKTGIIVFVATRHHAEYINDVLKANKVVCTTIYGSMDLSTRQSNLALFTTSRVPILIVTDLAARGLDIPILNIVIHYDCPSSPKLYIHRTGRTARGGREGTALAIYTPNEVPYLLDLLLFIGHDVEKYTEPIEWKDLSPSHLYYGRIPRIIIDDETERIEHLHRDNIEIATTYKSVNNAYKLYYKMRPEPSSRSIARAKEFDTRLIHPLFLSMVDTQEMEGEKVRESLHTFRPHNTIWEDEKVKGDTAIMQKKRRMHQYAILKAKEEQKKKDLENHTTEEAPITAEELERFNREMEKKNNAVDTTKPHIPKALRKKAKKEGKQITHDDLKEMTNNLEDIDEIKIEETQKDGYKDDKYYIDPERPLNMVATNEFLGVSQNEQKESFINDAIFELMPDNASQINSQRRMVRWDNEKKRYVKGTVGELQGNKRIRNESGNVITAKNLKSRGEIYKKWKNRNKGGIYDREDNLKKGQKRVIEFNDDDDSGKRTRTNERDKGGKRIRNELKSRDDIRRDLKEKEKNKIKQMNKKDRRELFKGGDNKKSSFKGGRQTGFSSDKKRGFSNERSSTRKPMKKGGFKSDMKTGFKSSSRGMDKGGRRGGDNKKSFKKGGKKF